MVRLKVGDFNVKLYCYRKYSKVNKTGMQKSKYTNTV